MNLLKIILFLGFSAIYVQVKSQKTHMLGIDFTTNVSNTKWNTKTLNGTPLISLGGGFNYQYSFSKLFHIEVNAFYNRFGYSYDNIYTDLIGNPTGEQSNTKVKFHYLNMPIKMGLSTRKRVSLLANIGVAPSLLIKSHYYLEPSPFSQGQEINFTEDVKPFNLFIVGECGIQALVSKNLIISLSAMFQGSPLTYSKYDSSISEDLKHYGTTGIVGIRYLFHFYNITATIPNWGD